MTNLVVTPGAVSGVHVWQHKVFEDLRGKLSKVYVSDSKEFGNLSFLTLEHFFTEIKRFKCELVGEFIIFRRELKQK